MEIIVGEDQLSLAIGKKGQNVRLAARLVGWDIKIVSEEILKKEIAKKMGRMMASGEAVPITALEGVTTSQAEVLSEKGIKDVEALAKTSVDDLVDYLDVSLDKAEIILAAANSIVEARNSEVEVPVEEVVEDSAEATEVAEEVVESEVAEEVVEDAAEEAVEIAEETVEPVETDEKEAK